MKIVFTPQAAIDVAEIFDFIDVRHPTGALKVKKAIDDSTKRLAKFPYLGVRTDEAYLRMLVVSRHPYLIFYSVQENSDEIFIVSIRHAARQR